MATILKGIPSEAEITRIEYEGPRIALYTKNYKFLRQNNYVISDIVNAVKRRVVVRTDKSIRMEEEEAKKLLLSQIPEESSVSTIFFDHALGEVIIEAGGPHILLAKKEKEVSFSIQEASDRIGWKIRVKQAPHIQIS